MTDRFSHLYELVKNYLAVVVEGGGGRWGVKDGRLKCHLNRLEFHCSVYTLTPCVWKTRICC